MSNHNSVLYFCASLLVGGCADAGLFKDDASPPGDSGDTGDGPEAHCTTDTEGWVTDDLEHLA